MNEFGHHSLNRKPLNFRVYLPASISLGSTADSNPTFIGGSFHHSFVEL